MENNGKARQATDGNTMRRMGIACWITKVTDTYSEYEILIAFPQQQWLRERASLLRLYVHCLSCSFLHFEFYDQSACKCSVQSTDTYTALLTSQLY